MKTEKSGSGASQSKTAMARIYEIDAAIASGKFPNNNDLASLLEISGSTISRDIEFMRSQLHAPIAYDRSRRGYYYAEKMFRIPGGFSGAEDLLALGMAKSILSLYRETPLYKAANHLLESIVAPIAADSSQDWLENRIVVPRIAAVRIEQPVWEAIIQGLKENRVIAFDYIGANDREYSPRRAHPYQLLFGSGAWYLYGFDEERKNRRIYSLSRMQNPELAREVFSLPQHFSYDEWTGDSYFGIFIGQEIYRFSIECYDQAARHAAERRWAADQTISEIEGGVLFEFSSAQYDRVFRWLLSCGGSAIPRQPQSLVDDWKAEIQKMRALAGDS